MTATGGPSDRPQLPDLTEVPVAQLLAEIPKDHAAATAAGRSQSETLQRMGQKAAEIYIRGGMSWRQIAAETGVSVRTVKRHAEPFLPSK
jgi:DNA-binding NarL/FixJ family response regulator